MQNENIDGNIKKTNSESIAEMFNSLSTGEVIVCEIKDKDALKEFFERIPL